uniref:Uncharacterized protein n=1 Tax=Anguilla anguilla TaxID=7936 RepID=A0A0E9RVD0_ANGAN
MFINMDMYKNQGKWEKKTKKKKKNTTKKEKNSGCMCFTLLKTKEMTLKKVFRTKT